MLKRTISCCVLAQDTLYATYRLPDKSAYLKIIILPAFVPKGIKFSSFSLCVLLPFGFKHVLGAQKNCLDETLLFLTHRQNKKIESISITHSYLEAWSVRLTKLTNSLFLFLSYNIPGL